MLNFKKERLGYTTVLHCSGAIVFPDADALRAAVALLPPSRKLVLDLADVITVDAAGLGVLVSLHRWAKSAGIEFKLMNPNSRVARMLEITRLNTALRFCSVQEMLGLLCSAREDAEKASAGNRRPTPDPFCTETGQGSRIAG